MIYHIINIIAPVFLIIGAGYLSTRKRFFPADTIDGLMKFAIQFAVPCLLFRATSTLDLKAAYDWPMMAAFYTAAAISFALASYLAHALFKRAPGESVAIGFGALFSNSVLIGLPISERAWGLDNMAQAFAIVSVHAPFCYLLGIATMEVLRSDGRSLTATSGIVIKAMFRNSLMIGIGLGFIVNVSGLNLPEVLLSAVDIVSEAALPVALFGIGGVLARYRLSHSLGEVSLICSCSLLVHPGLAYLFSLMLNVPQSSMRTAVLIAAMAPGINSYLFASMYQRGQSIAASVVVVGTAASVLSVSGWLWLLS